MRKILFAMAALTAACSPNPTAELKHDAGRFMNEVSPYQWYTIDEATYASKESAGQHYATPDHVMTRRMQAWADRIREEIIRTTPQARIVPRPLVRIIKSTEINAYVNGTDVCVDVAITKNPNKMQPPAAGTYLQTWSQYSYINTRNPGCVAFEGTLEQKRAFVEFSLRSMKNCKVSIFRNQLALAPNCEISPTENDFQGFSGFTTHNYVTFFSNLIESMNEQETVAVLAHELGHYYMGHVTVSDQVYNFFYDLGDHNPDHKPDRLPSTHPLAQLGEQIANTPQPWYVQVENQKYHSLTFHIARQIAQSFDWSLTPSACTTATPNCVEQCQDFRQHMSTQYDGVLSDFPYWISRTPEAAATYARYEQEMQSCLAGVDANWQQYNVSSGLNMIFDYKITFGALPLTPGESTLSLLDRADAVVVATVSDVYAKRNALVAQAQREKLGWYTTEQEADDVATEMVSRLGMDPMTEARSELTFEELFTGDKTCRQQFDLGFPTFISPGDFSEIHHDTCYRAYNSYREVQAHAEYFARFRGTAVPDVQPGITWDEAVAQLRALPL